MAKSRAQKKAERKAREEAERKGQGAPESDSRAQHDTQVPKSGDIAEIEAVEAGIAAGAPEEALETPDAPKKSRIESREEKRKKKEAEKRAKAEQKKKEEELLAKRAEAAKGEKKRSGVIAFLASCIAELRRVQWPDRETLIQATAVTLVFVIVAALYLGVLDLAFNWLVQRVI
ncbi:MAG: preprotein translocase subunit SecE [Solirubrobacterales bacterium]